MTRGDRQKQEMTYDNKNCNDDSDAFDPVDRRLALTKWHPEWNRPSANDTTAAIDNKT